ncbi:MAG: hypothetical protein HRU10_12390 [Opitutales bacterium]|nr:hypothetical protein [Opitutales bacterium]
MKLKILLIVAALTSGGAVVAQTSVIFDSVNRLNLSNDGNVEVDNTSNHSLLVGDSGSNSNRFFETIAIFDIEGLCSEIEQAASITLELDYSEVLGAGVSGITAYGYESVIGDATGPSQRSLALAGTSAGTVSSFSQGLTGGTAVWDTTSIVKAASNNDADYIGFLFTSGISSNDGNSTADAVRFFRQGTIENGLSLEIAAIPEPSVFATFAGILAFIWVSSRRLKANVKI